MWADYWGGGGQRVCWPPLSNYWGGRLRILGGARFRILGGGPNSEQAHDVVLTSMRRNDVAPTSFRRHVPPRLLINQCQIITFLTVKSDNIEIEE